MAGCPRGESGRCARRARQSNQKVGRYTSPKPAPKRVAPRQMTPVQSPAQYGESANVSKIALAANAPAARPITPLATMRTTLLRPALVVVKYVCITAPPPQCYPSRGHCPREIAGSPPNRLLANLAK